MESKLFKRLFSMCLVIAMVLSMCPTMVFAESTDETTPNSTIDSTDSATESEKVDTTDPNYCPHCEAIVSTWTDWDGATAFEDGKHYRLAADVQLTGVVTIAASTTVVLDLNGKTITAAAESRCFEVSGEFVIVNSIDDTDAEGNYTGLITGGKAGGSDAETQRGGNICVNEGATLKLYSGTIANGFALNAGGNVKLDDSAKFYMYGGTIADGTAETSTSVGSGGNMNVDGGALFEMHGGTITGGNASVSAGNIYNYKGTITLYGGTIEDGTAVKNGGNIWLNGANAKLIFKNGDGKISGGNAVTGGSIYSDNNSAQIIMEDGEISGGHSTGAGGNIYIYKGKLYMSGGVITNGTADTHSGNIYVVGETIINGTAEVSEGTAKGGYAGNIYFPNASSTREIGGNAVIKNGESSSSGGNIYMTGASSVLTVKDNAEISGGIAEGGGGNIAQNTSSTLIVAGGVIKDGISNATENWGGGNIQPFRSTFIMTGGVISGGTAAYRGNSIYFRNSVAGSAFYGGTLLPGGDGVSSDVYLGVENAVTVYNLATYVTKFSGYNFVVPACATQVTTTDAAGATVCMVYQNALDASGACTAETACGHTYSAAACTNADCGKAHAPIVYKACESCEATVPFAPYTDSYLNNGPIFSHYYLVEDVTLAEEVGLTAGETLCIDMNGYDMTTAADVSRGIRVTEATLNITNTSAETSELKTGGGGVIYTTTAQVSLKNITVSGGEVGTGSNGGNICLNTHSTIVIDNCIITGGTAGKNGGNICCYNSDITIKGNTTIEKGSAGNNGDDIYLGSVSTVVMYDGTVTDICYLPSTGSIHMYGGTIEKVLIYNYDNYKASFYMYGGTVDNLAVNGKTKNDPGEGVIALYAGTVGNDPRIANYKNTTMVAACSCVIANDDGTYTIVHTGGTATCENCTANDIYEGGYTFPEAFVGSHTADDATCTEDGLCSNCNAVVNKATGHEHPLTAVPQKDATCTASGLKAYSYCSVCNAYYVDENGEEIADFAAWQTGDGLITALGHEDGDDKDHICDHDGCNVVASEHKYTASVTAPTCTEDGYTTYTCACGDTYTEAGEAATGHEHVESYTDPTTEKDGFWTYTCTCGDTYTKIEEGTRLHVNIPAVDAGQVSGNTGDLTTDEKQEIIDDIIHNNAAAVEKDVFLNSPANDAVIEQMKAEDATLADKQPVLNIVLKGMDVNSDNIANKVTYDVTPMLGNKKISLAEAITFYLPVADGLIGYVNVYHEGTLILAKVEIVIIDGHKYVEVSSKDFSEFAVELYEEPEAPTKVEVDTLDELLDALADTSNDLPIEITQEIAIPAGQTVTIDLNGKTVTAAKNGETVHIYALKNNGTLTITDTSAEKSGSISSRGVYNYGKLTLEAGTINAIDGDGGYAVNNKSGAEFIMNGGVLAATYEDDYESENGGFDATALGVPAGTTATLNGGKITSVTDFTFAVNAAGTVTIPADSTIEISGAHGAISVSGGTTTINAGTFSVASDGKARTDNVVYVSGGSLIINGGTFTGDADAPVGGCCVYDAAGTAVINGGTFTGSAGGDVWGVTGGTTITGGTFENLIETGHIAPGYELGEDGKIVESKNYVIEVTDAEGNTTSYTGFEGFSNLDLTDCTIKLLGDVSDKNLILNGDKNVTLDLNGFTFSRTGSSSPAISLTVGSELKIVDTSAEKTGLAISDTNTVWIMNGTLVIEDGTIETTSTTKAAIDANAAEMTIDGGKIVSAGNAISVGANFMESKGTSTVVINDGEIEAEGYGIVNGGYAKAETSVEISGGSITSGNDSISFTTGTVAVSGGTFSSDVSDYCVDGFETTDADGDGIYDVTEKKNYVAEVNGTQYESLLQAWQNATANSTIKLLADVDMTGVEGMYVPSSTLTLDLNDFTLKVPYQAIAFAGDNFTICNGTIDSLGASYGLWIGGYADAAAASNVTIEDVTVIGGINIKNATNVTLNNVTATGIGYYAVWVESNASGVVINSGSYTGAEGKAAVSAANADALTVKGGTFSSNVTVYCEEGKHTAPEGGVYVFGAHSYTSEDFEATFEADAYTVYTCACGDTYTVTHEGTKKTAVAEVNGTQYESLLEAWQNATANSTIKLLADVDMTGVEGMYVPSSTLTLDLNGFTLKVPFQAIAFAGDNFTICNGTIDSLGASYGLWIGGYADAAAASNVTIEDVTVIGGINIKNATNVTLNNVTATGIGYYAVWVESNASGVVINSGSYTGANAAVSAANADALTVKGGTYSSNVTAFCEEGKHTAPEGGVYVYGDHDYTAVVTDPTCTEDGYTTYTCACGDSYTDDEVAATGHNYTGVITTNPSATTEGAKTYTCTCGDSYTETLPVLPQATVTDKGATTFVGSYYIYDVTTGKISSATGGINLPKTLVFTAQDQGDAATNNYYADFNTDFYVKLDGLSADSVKGTGCYLAGYYEAYELWVVIPLDNVDIQNGIAYPLLAIAGQDFSYEMICNGVQEFTCGLYLSDEFLTANPDVQVTVDLGLREEQIKDLGELENLEYFESKGFEYEKEDLDAELVAMVGDVKYYSLAEAIEAAKNGGTVELLADIQLEGDDNIQITNGMDITFIGNYTISGNDGFYVTGGKLTLGEGLTVIANVYNAVYLRGGEVITSANLIANDIYSAIQGNGNYAGNVTIKGGNITAPNSTAIYWPQNATLTVEGGNITGLTGIEMRAGTLKMTGGKVTATAALSTEANGNGTTVNGAAVALSQHNTNLPVVIEITGGELIATNAAGVAFYQGNHKTEASASENIQATIGADVELTGEVKIAEEGFKMPEAADGSYTLDVANYVAQVGDKKFETVLDAVAYAIENDASEVKVLSSVRELLPTDVEWILNADLTITADEAVEIVFYNNGTSYDLVIDSVKYQNSVLTVGENVTIQVEDRIIWIGYYFQDVEVEVYGTMKAYQIWMSETVTVQEGGKLIAANEALVMAYDAHLNIEGGTVDANYFQINGGQIVANGATINSGKINISASQGYVSILLDEGSVWNSTGNLYMANSSNPIYVYLYDGELNTVIFEGYQASQITANGGVYLWGGNWTDNGKLIVEGTLEVSEGSTLTANVFGTVAMSGGDLITPEGYEMIGANADYYYTTDAVFTMAGGTGDITVHSGTLTLVPDLWYTGAGQTLTIAEGAKFVVPAGKTLYVNESTVVVDGEIALEGTILLTANATVAYADGTLVEKFTTNAGDAVIYENGVYKVHDHDYDAVVTDPTCTEGGYTTYTCACGDSYTGNEVAATGHSHEAVYTPATNTENAYTTYTCACGDTYTEVEEGTVLHYAVNETTGESYASVQAALNAAAKGDTVKLLKDAVEEDVYVGSQKTLDLNGHKLTVTGSVAASFGTSHIIDSTNGNGLLVADKAEIALNSNNKQLPLWSDEGARFVDVNFGEALSFVDKTGAANANVAYFRFAFNDKAAKTILDDYLANGSEGTCISIRIKATYTTASGTVTQYFDIPSSLVEQYINSGNGWDANMFKLYLTGVEGKEIHLTAQIVSTANAEAVVVIESDTLS